jgi:hypothetical protein
LLNAQHNNKISKVQQSGSISENTKFDGHFFFKLFSSFLDIAVVEHETSNNIANDSGDQSWHTTTERTLIR